MLDKNSVEFKLWQMLTIVLAIFCLVVAPLIIAGLTQNIENLRFDPPHMLVQTLVRLYTAVKNALCVSPVYMISNTSRLANSHICLEKLKLNFGTD